MIPLFAGLSLPLLPQMQNALSAKTNNRPLYEPTIVTVYMVVGASLSFIAGSIAAGSTLLMLGNLDLQAVCGLSCLGGIIFAGLCLAAYWEIIT